MELCEGKTIRQLFWATIKIADFSIIRTRIQCDQTTRLLFRYLAIYNNEICPIAE